MEPKHQVMTITKLVQMIFNVRCGYFMCVDSLSRGINTDSSQSLNMISVNFNWSTRPWTIIQREIFSTKLQKPFLTISISHSTPPHTVLILFFCFSCVFTFLETRKHNMPKLLLFSFHLQY